MCFRFARRSLVSDLSAFRTDYVLTQDKSFKKYAKQYAQDQDLFFKEFVFPSFRSLGLLTSDTASLPRWLVSLNSVCQLLNGSLLSLGS